MLAAVSKRRLILAAGVAFLVYGMTGAVLGTLLPDLSNRFHFTPDQNGTIAFAQSFGLVVASFGVGPLVDRRGPKTGLLAGLSVMALALGLLPSAGSYASVLWAMLLLGLGSGLISTAGNVLIILINPERGAATLNLLNVFFPAGGFATPFIGAYLFSGNTIGLCYLISAMTAAGLLVHILTRMPAPARVTGGMRNVRSLIATPALILLAFSLFLYVACEVGLWNWLSVYLVAQGLSQETALKILSFGFALGILLGRLGAGSLLAKVRPLNVILCSAVLMTVTTVALLQTHDAATAGGLAFCAGLAMAPVFPTTLAVIGATFPTGTATAVGVATMAGWLGPAVTSKVIGLIAGDDPARLRTALLVLPVFSVLMVAVNLALRRMPARS